MSLQFLSTTVSGKLCAPLARVGASSGQGLQVRRASSVCYLGDGSKVGLVRHLDRRSHTLSRALEWRIRPTRVQIRASQAVTTDGDSSNGDGVGSSNHATNLSSVWSNPEALRPFMASSLQGLQEGFRSLKERGLQSSKEGFGEAYSRLKTGEGKSESVNARWSEIRAHGGRAWQSQEPWIKWPLAIFVGAYLAILVSCGTAVAGDLLPLWIIGPLIAGSVIRIAFIVGDLAQRGFASTQPFREAVVGGTLQLWEDAKKGELVGKIRSSIEQKNLEFRQDAAKRWADFVLYVKSGQAATDFKGFLLLLFSMLTDWSTERYEDFTDWVRPYWRAFSRLMKRLF